MPPTSEESTPPTESDPRCRVLGTAGHIDHGKTSLVHALTHINTDRLPEEQRRGMTIELGFAHLEIDDLRFGIVDVPGHERFVKTMVAGATGIDIALIIVAADDSVMLQTVEHVDILNLLGVDRAVVAVTKIDMVDGDMVELVVEEVRELLAGTPLAESPIVPVSSVTEEGLEALKREIASVARDADAPIRSRPFRMCIDRVFTVAGRGTIVTGSVHRGTVDAGDTLEVWPGGHTCRVRGLQTHGRDEDHLGSGERAAVNVSGIEREFLQRGSDLATPGYLNPSPMMDARITVLGSHPRPLKSASVVRLGIGTVEVPVRVVLLEGDRLEPGGSGFAQIRCGQPLTAVFGQRFILRDDAATRTIGGGTVLRPVARRRKHALDRARLELQQLDTGAAEDRVEDALRQAAFVRPSDLQLIARTGVELDDLPGVIESLQRAKRYVAVPGADHHVVPALLDDVGDRLTRWLERFHEKNRELPGRPADAVLGYLERTTEKSLARPLFDLFVKRKRLKKLGRFICLPAFAPELSAADEKILGAMVREIEAGVFQPPLLADLSMAKPADRKRIERLATLAVALGELVKIDATIYLHARTEEALRAKVAESIAEHDGATVSQIRERLESSRKYVVPFMEHLDRIGFTKRRGDVRVLAEPAPRDQD
jgi:selenocysteine-specific elongation factor